MIRFARMLVIELVVDDVECVYTITLQNEEQSVVHWLLKSIGLLCEFVRTTWWELIEWNESSLHTLGIWKSSGETWARPFDCHRRTRCNKSYRVRCPILQAMYIGPMLHAGFSDLMEGSARAPSLRLYPPFLHCAERSRPFQIQFPSRS